MHKEKKALRKLDGGPRPERGRAGVDGRHAGRQEKQADKLAELIKAANDDVSDTRKELFAFVSSLVFVVVTTHAITARDLLALAPVKLPFIGVAVPLYSFFYWTPPAIVAVHTAVLLRLARLREKLGATRDAIDGVPADRNRFRLRVVSNFLAQRIVTPPPARTRYALLWFVYLVVVALAPLLSLLFITYRALPLHDAVLTSCQNVVFAIDLALIAYLAARRWLPVAAVLGVVLAAITFLVLCVPDSELDQWSRDNLWSRPIVSPVPGIERRAFWPTAFLLESEVDPVTRHPSFLGLSRNIILVDDKPSAARSVGEAESGSKDGGGAKTVTQPTLNLNGRNLRYAVFDRSALSGAELVAADLTGASLFSADLSRAQFGCRYPEWDKSAPDKQCTKIESAGLQGIDLRGAKFEWRDKQRQSLAGINLSGARMEGVDLRSVDLSRAILSGAKLAGAYLDYARFVGASLTGADLTGVRAWGADFSFSSMRTAHLDGADFSNGARFLAADMRETSLFRTTLSGAGMEGSILRGAQVWETKPPRKEALAWTDLDKLVVKPPGNDLFLRLQRVIDDNPGLTVAAVDADVPVTPWDHSLKQLRDAAGSRAQLFEHQPAWKEAKEVLGSKKYDVNSYTRALTEFACLSASYVEAIAGYGPVWMYLGSDYGGWSDYGYTTTYSDYPINMIQDSRLAQLKNWPSIWGLENFAGDYDDTGASPFELFDLSRLVAALDGDPEKCPATKQVSQDVKQRLRDAATQQKADREKKAREEQDKHRACLLLQSATEAARCLRPDSLGEPPSGADAWLRMAW